MLTVNEQKILVLLGKGKNDAASKEYLCNMTGLDERTVRELICSLIDKGHCVCSNSSSKGYFIAQTLEEVQHASYEDRKRAGELLRKSAKRLDNFYVSQNMNMEDIKHE